MQGGEKTITSKQERKKKFIFQTFMLHSDNARYPAAPHRGVLSPRSLPGIVLHAALSWAKRRPLLLLQVSWIAGCVLLEVSGLTPL